MNKVKMRIMFANTEKAIMLVQFEGSVPLILGTNGDGLIRAIDPTLHYNAVMYLRTLQYRARYAFWFRHVNFHTPRHSELLPHEPNA